MGCQVGSIIPQRNSPGASQPIASLFCPFLPFPLLFLICLSCMLLRWCCLFRGPDIGRSLSLGSAFFQEAFPDGVAKVAVGCSGSSLCSLSETSGEEGFFPGPRDHTQNRGKASAPYGLRGSPTRLPNGPKTTVPCVLRSGEVTSTFCSPLCFQVKAPSCGNLQFLSHGASLTRQILGNA